ncbi:4-phosphopantetheinyl transferase superfamily protein [Pyrenophora tritici-repentis]|uniref:4-phosphopantetheinyl transferase superfamily protein n=1 Tax=Pyrenophora tritici-repentis TaxID=45151 RepID=A0A2W1DW05_9PLEO|nr:4-phosphopantetheinyl transferase superfamily protein [Pyrenophora tritici-repentis]KAF7451824.1 4-phosphopantetheinyl transferase superfamily protein [Pyrenophora tritici-repentis]KAF7575053.1 AcpS, Phosphopantetheinyl transferase (holo-ACP synthase) [Pyrenophora tritici-repentis]KAG9386185.1 4-phosphopantetheinyl transferase superfamily protein [Pyrenophora tritici-repentis]KAI0573614.1 4-phosphopantetheinyl transferase superfamily protein [Pyrenophora tritici-repentis]
MPLRPFPIPFKVGTDICYVPRIRKFITQPSNGEPQRPLRRLLRKLLTEHERRYFWQRFGSGAPFNSIERVSQFLAGRFAAKEACRKACTHLDPKSRGFQHVMILPVTANERDRYKSGRPQGLILDEVYTAGAEPEADLVESRGVGTVDEGIGEVAENSKPLADINELNGQLCEISISHDGDYATAVAIVAFAKG